MNQEQQVCAKCGKPHPTVYITKEQRWLCSNCNYHRLKYPRLGI